jgi:hypothetical protein
MWIYVNRFSRFWTYKERTAKSYIKFMRDREIILKDPSNAGYYIIGHINT